MLAEGYGKIAACDLGMRHFRPTGTVLSRFTDQVVQTCNSATGDLLQNAPVQFSCPGSYRNEIVGPPELSREDQIL
ncbi:MAG: hypothetical protein CMJ81_20970 [Planctomycetaceae bacterium]|nr:hypothetical protein [Planctomycetaceae bacterium]MBP62899.1 hypothetical protein [Planctomycetaceae bacterium]